MRFFVLCLDNSFGPWHEIYQEGILKTWCSPPNAQITCRSFMGRNTNWPVLNRSINRLLVSRAFAHNWNKFQSNRDLKQVQVIEDKGVIRVDLPELISNITLKTLAAMKYAFENYEFDYLIRVNTTCYYNRALLQDFLQENCGNILYAGPIVKGKEFVSGWGIILSRECLEILLASTLRSDQRYFDDEAIGRALKRSKISPLSLPFIEIFSSQNLNQISNEEILNTPSFRMKFTQQGIRKDYFLMRRLHSRIRNLV